MNKLVFLIVFVCIITLNLSAQLIPDDNFRMKINENLGQPPNYEPTIEDLNGITGVLQAGSSEIISIEGAQYLTNVSTFYLQINSLIDISALSGLTNLLVLYLNSNQIFDISILSGLINLDELHLTNNQISDISTLSSLQNLTVLSVGNNLISDISPLAGLDNLHGLVLYNNQITNISALSSLTNLEYFNLINNQISDISVISGFINLTCLRLGHNLINDISAISGLTNLVELNLGNNQISDISVVTGLTNLDELNLSYNQISDITAILNLTNLENLNVENNQISDISAVLGLTNLNRLDLHGNLISNISVLSALPDLIHLFLGDNQITDISNISGLLNLNSLFLYHNQITDISSLVENTGLGSGDRLLLDLIGYANPLSHEALDVHIPILESRGFIQLCYPSIPNDNAACFPSPARNEIDVSPGTDLVWSGNFPSREAVYAIWLGEASDELENIGIGIAIGDTLYSISPILNPNTDYWWKVRAVTDADTIWSGLWHYTTGNPNSGDENQISILSYELFNYPNPFNPSTTIEFSIQDNSKVELIIYNIKGQKIKTLVNNEFTKGSHSIIWDGNDDSGKPVSSGIYFYTLNVNGKTESVKKCLLLK